ncbi:MAG: hypothetical protein IKE95_03730 [Methanobrevibacter sp.]|nr:hypothetical protein [Methanobrevibacter sp.]
MNKFDEKMNNIKEQLKSLLTADNTEQITKAVASLDELSTEHNATVNENSNLKNKIVEIVKGTTFKEQSKETNSLEPEREVSLDEALKQAEQKILQERGKK